MAPNTAKLAGAFVLLALLQAPNACAGLIAEWTFDQSGGTIAYDSVGGLDGTLNGNATFVPGLLGNAIQLNSATDDYVSMGYVLEFAGSGPFSISAWAKIAPGDTGQYAVAGIQYWGFSNGYLLGINGFGATDKAYFYSSTTVAGQGGTTTTIVNDGAWHLLVGVFDGSTASIFVDGGPAEATVANGGPLYPCCGVAPFMVGGSVGGNYLPDGEFTGLIDDVRVYDNALTRADVQALYDEGMAVPEPGTLLLLAAGLGLVGLQSRRTQAD